MSGEFIPKWPWQDWWDAGASFQYEGPRHLLTFRFEISTPGIPITPLEVRDLQISVPDTGGTRKSFEIQLTALNLFPPHAVAIGTRYNVRLQVLAEDQSLLAEIASTDVFVTERPPPEYTVGAKVQYLSEQWGPLSGAVEEIFGFPFPEPLDPVSRGIHWYDYLIGFDPGQPGNPERFYVQDFLLRGRLELAVIGVAPLVAIGETQSFSLIFSNHWPSTLTVPVTVLILTPLGDVAIDLGLISIPPDTGPPTIVPVSFVPTIPGRHTVRLMVQGVTKQVRFYVV